MNIKKPLIVLLIFSLIFIVAGCDMFAPEGVDENSSVENTQYEVAIPESDDQLNDHVPGEIIVGLKDLSYKNEIAKKVNGEIIEVIEPLKALKIRLKENQEIVKAMETVSKETQVEFYQPNYSYHLVEPVEQKRPGNEELVNFSETSHYLSSVDAPDFDVLQYGPQKIKAPAAWDQDITGDGVVISVIDTGVDADHQDLEGRVLEGWNVIDSNNNTSDYDGHGTHVSGIAAAAGDNGQGMVGVAWDAEILPLRVFSPDVATYSDVVAQAIVISADPDSYSETAHLKPADIINMSLGSQAYSPLEQAAIDFAIENNVVVVSSMGNSYKENIMYPAANEGVISVGATDPNDDKTKFSTTGRHISVSAPGKLVYSSLPNDNYGRWSGTSMSSPFVAGAAALILQADDTLKPSEVKKLLEETASSDSFSKETGYGRINVAQALDKGTPTTLYGEIKVELELVDINMNEAEFTLYQDNEDGKVEGNASISIERYVHFRDLVSSFDYDLTISVKDSDGNHIIKDVNNISVEEGETTEVTVQIEN